MYLPLYPRVAMFLAMVVFVFSPAALRAQNAAGENALISYDSQFHPVIGENGGVAAQETIAARVGRDILKSGGNAVDAAVAMGFALAVTHPQAGNLGGGGFMLVKLAGRDDAIAIDYREMAPSGADRDMFLDADGNVDIDRVRFSRLSAGVPGSVMGLTTAQEKYGVMSLKDVMAPAIRLAEKGFPMPRAMSQALASRKSRFARDPSTLGYFFKPDGSAYLTGEVLRQRDLAKTLKQISKNGASGFYEGPVAALIVEEMAANGGLITLEDLKNYRAVEREAVKGSYRGYEIISMPPPSSGGVHVIEMLNILEGYDLAALGHNSADYIAVLVEAMRRAYADRSEYLGDPDYYHVPVEALTDKKYAARLRSQIDPAKATRSTDVRPGLYLPKESPQTTHFSVADKMGNAVAVTTTLNFTFGSGYSVDGAGFLLNNEMDDFSAKPGAPNGFGLIGGAANAIEPGKRPLSSMTPTIVLKDGTPWLVTGSPGGSTIINIVLQVILNAVDFNMNVMQAVASPRIHHQWFPDVVVVEPGISRDTLKILEARGFIILKDEDGGFAHRVIGSANSIMIENGAVFGAADPRRPGAAAEVY
jgi:gamma-glutamyltranspeptidase / glutathione hydrolase